MASLNASMCDGVDVGKLPEGALFAVEKLQHQHARDRFLQVGIDPRNRDADPPVGIAHFVAENLGCGHDERQHGEGDQRQLPVHIQHDRQDEDEHEHILKDRDHAGGEHFVQCVHIGGDPRHQTSHRVLVEEADVQVLQVAEDLAAQIEHHFLAGPLHQVGLDELQREGEQQKPDIKAANLGDAGEGCVAEVVTDPGM